MRVFRTCIVAASAVVFLCLLALGSRPAAAQNAKKAKAEIQAKIKMAMENYELLEFEEARSLLNGALAIAKKAKLQTDPAVAQVHLALGVVYYAGLQDVESAKLAFMSAVEIDPKVQIDPAYRTPDMAKLLDEARADGGGGGAVEPDEPDEPVASSDEEIDCATVTGVQHELIETAPTGAAKQVVAHVGAEVGAAKVAVMYRPQGGTEFAEAKMSKKGECTYVGAIPPTGLRGELVHYYVGAFDGAGKFLDGMGSSGSPNIIEISGVAAGGMDDEDPLSGGGGGGGGSEGISGGVTVGPKKPSKVYLNLAVGSGGGYVTGETEIDRNEVKCCFAPALLHVMPELGFYIGPKTALAAAFRMGFPVGANVMGHSTAAPAALIRVRHSLGEGQDGLQVTGSVGGGFLKNTIKLEEAPADMDTDIVALGPLLVGAGAGYTAGLGGPLKFVAEVNALAGIPVIGEIGSNPKQKLNFGVQFDVNLGIMFGF